MFIDANTNGVNDYFEDLTHDAGSAARMTGTGVYGHDFVDDDGNGMYDYWQEGGRGHGGMMGSSGMGMLR